MHWQVSKPDDYLRCRRRPFSLLNRPLSCSSQSFSPLKADHLPCQRRSCLIHKTQTTPGFQGKLSGNSCEIAEVWQALSLLSASVARHDTPCETQTARSIAHLRVNWAPLSGRNARWKHNLPSQVLEIFGLTMGFWRLRRLGVLCISQMSWRKWKNLLL